MEVAIQIAKANGVGWVWLRNAGHFGPAAAYTMRATQEGFIGIALTNSSPAMAALGGWRAVLGANPWSIAVPRGPGKWPLVLDIANTIVARGRIKNAAVRGETLPADWALDCQGKPTTDPTEAVNGSLFPFGGHKGYAIAFMMEALTAAIAGSAMSVEVQAPIPGTKGHQGVGQVFAAINPAVAISQDELEARLDLLIAYMRSSGDAEAAQPILVPGEREAQMAEEQTCLGIALPAEVRAKVARWADAMGLSLPAGCNPY
jgi:LDH2 family malate/lactate/ureidoglycolate dehydrogenase